MMIGPRGSFGRLALVLAILGGGSARAGTVFFSHSTELPPGIEARNIALYEHESARHDLSPEAFDHRQPLIGRVLDDPVYDQKMLSRWEDHPWSFEHHHRELWRVLDGERLRHRHPGEPLASLGLNGDPPTFPFNPTTGGDGPTIEPQGAGPGVPTVPEPASGILMIAGLIAVAVVRRRHRRRMPKDRA